MRLGLPCSVILASAACWTAAAGASAGDVLEVVGGETALEFNRHVLSDLGLEVTVPGPVGEAGEFLRADFSIAALPRLRIQAPGGSFEHLAGGALRHRDGFELRWPGGGQVVFDFELAPSVGQGLFELRTADGAVPFFLDGPHARHFASGEFVFLNMDLRMSLELALRLDAPEAAGTAIGSADVRLRLAAPAGSGGVACEPDLTGDVDVELTGITALYEVYHDAGRVAMAPAVDLYNLGPADVEWYRPIQPDGGGDPSVVGPHPYLAMSFYRLADGVMQQVGRGDVKHAFFAANTGCDCAGGQILFAGCSDLYSAVTNSVRVNLAPRSEVTASTGAWQSAGSHFDGDPVDDLRSHHGEGADHPDPFEHRLAVPVEDLLTPGGRYFIEAWYITPGDVDIFNSMGRREVAPRPGTPWTFPFSDSGVTAGPALDAWVDRAAPPPGTAATVLDTGEGRLELVSVTGALPGGAYRYDYGLMNFDFDRQIRSFSVPLPAGATLASITFDDGDEDPANDWQISTTASEILFATPAGDPALGALDWGILYNFGFDANAAPTDAVATLAVLEPGSPAQLTVAGKVPGGALLATNRLAVELAGSGLGGVTSAPAGIGCPPDCDELFAPDTSVELAAAAEPGSALIRWLEGGTSLGDASPRVTVLDEDRALVAVFELCDRDLGAQSIAGAETFEACEVLTAGAGFEVLGGGDVTLRAGSVVELANGCSVAAAGRLAAEIDPLLLP